MGWMGGEAGWGAEPEIRNADFVTGKNSPTGSAVRAKEPALRLPAAFHTGYAPDMTLFTRSLWPERVRRPYLRLAGALIAAPVVLASVLTLLAFLIAGSTEATEDATLAMTNEAAVVFFITLPAFTLTFGLAGVGLLWSLARRGVLAWLITGAGAGALVATGHGLFVEGGIIPIQMAVAVVLGLGLFTLIRWIAGVRSS